MAGSNRITHNNPEPGDVLPGFLDSASSLCDMTDTTMAAVPDEIMSIQADEACGAEYGARSDRRVNSRGGCRSRRPGATVGTLDLRIPKPGSGPCLPTDLPGRHARADRALAAAVAETCAAGTPAREAGAVPRLCMQVMSPERAPMPALPPARPGRRHTLPSVRRGVSHPPARDSVFPIRANSWLGRLGHYPGWFLWDEQTRRSDADRADTLPGQAGARPHAACAHEGATIPLALLRGEAGHVNGALTESWARQL